MLAALKPHACGPGDDVRQLHSPEVVVEVAGQQPRSADRIEGLLRLGKRVDAAVGGDSDLVRVGQLVVRGEHLNREVRRKLEDRVEGRRRVFGEPFALTQRLDIEPLVQQEVQIPRVQQWGISADAQLHDVAPNQVSGCAGGRLRLPSGCQSESHDSCFLLDDCSRDLQL